MMRHLLLVVTSVLLCQCNTPHRSLAPVISPTTGQSVILALKNHDSARPSQILAAMENCGARMSKDQKAHKGALEALGKLDPATQKASYILNGAQLNLKKVNDQPITVVLPMVTVLTTGIPLERVSAAMPSIQGYCYTLLSAEFRQVDKSELKKKAMKP